MKQMVLDQKMPGTRESERRASDEEGKAEAIRSYGSDVPGHKHVEADKVEASHAESDDRILKGKRIDRHDGSGDRQKCRPPFCVSEVWICR